MKRRLALLPLLLVALPACAGGLAPPADGPDVYYESSAPLRARLVDAVGGLAIQTSSPAHVAVFEVVPGRGMGLMYPAYGRERSHVADGFFRLPRNHLRPYTWHYASDVAYSPMGPRYYLLVASRAPLRVQRFQDDPGAMREWFGLRRFAALNPRPAMDELVETVVPPQADEDWDTDLLTLWPQDSRGLFDDRRLVRVVCGNGMVVTTSWESAHVACGLFNTGQSNETPPQRPDSVQAPSDSVQVPTRRRPEPRSTDDDAANGDDRAAAPRRPARVEQWPITDDRVRTDGLRRPHARPVGDDDATGTHVVRRVPARAEGDERPETRDGERDPFRGRYQVPRGRPGTWERGEGREPRSRPAVNPAGEGASSRPATPRREAPIAPTLRREPPQRTEPARPRGGDPR